MVPLSPCFLQCLRKEFQAARSIAPDDFDGPFEHLCVPFEFVDTERFHQLPGDRDVLSCRRPPSGEHAEVGGLPVGPRQLLRWPEWLENRKGCSLRLGRFGRCVGPPLGSGHSGERIGEHQLITEFLCSIDHASVLHNRICRSTDDVELMRQLETELLLLVYAEVAAVGERPFV